MVLYLNPAQVAVRLKELNEKAGELSVHAARSAGLVLLDVAPVEDGGARIYEPVVLEAEVARHNARPVLATVALVELGDLGRLATYAVARLLVVRLHVELVFGVRGRVLDDQVVLVRRHFHSRPIVNALDEHLAGQQHSPILHLIPVELCARYKDLCKFSRYKD